MKAMLARFFCKRITLSFGITVCNESVELERLILFLLLYKDRHDEIIVLQDVTRPDDRVTDVLHKYQHDIIVRTATLNNDFASFKNRLIDVASGDYMFQIDADEIPERHLLQQLKQVLAEQPDVDCFGVPRINIVEGITETFLTDWQWQVDEKKRINFPDYQLRIFRLHQSIVWKNKVHEELDGIRNCYYLPTATDAFCLIHVKDIHRQQQQNNFYRSL